ncbi:OLC1v1023092C1 [Oldenlandia corymbosa var. corymbosa]|uniref:Protein DETOXIFICATION n=1 Tax=Oldenlandia corymbosa var. corymbosa TaxID=529605 RepID=A0AAV1C0V0_OLDCO|nr:OLC1v1023092C1 [Oldenlandia corymbosa var. corymbosa]
MASECGYPETITIPLLGLPEGELAATEQKWWNKILDLKEAKNQLILLSIPLSLTSLSHYLIPLVSVMFAGHLGELQLAGATLANSWAVATGWAFAVGLSGGLETLCGQGYGAKLHGILGMYLQASCMISFFFCILLSTNILRFLRAQSVVLPLVVCSVFPLLIHIPLAYGLVHWTNLGYCGPALAASISIWISALMLIFYVGRSDNFKQTWVGLSKESLKYIPQTLQLALPSAAMLCENTEATAYMIPYGLIASASTRVSNELGAGNPTKAKKAMIVSIKLCALLTLAMALDLSFGQNTWASLFTDSPIIMQQFASVTPLLIASIVIDIGCQGVLSEPSTRINGTNHIENRRTRSGGRLRRFGGAVRCEVAAEVGTAEAQKRQTTVRNGNDSLEICRVLNGMWQTSGGWGRIDRDDAVQAMLEYTDAGLTTFDMADHYGPAEDLYGIFINRVRRERPPEVLDSVRGLTKWVPPPVKMTGSFVRESIDVSRRRMDVASLDMLQFHWWDYSNSGYLDALKHLTDLKEEGKIKTVALTNFDTARLQKIIENGIPVVSNQVQHSVVDMRPQQKMAELCQLTGVKLITYGTVMGGLLSEKFLDTNLAIPFAGPPLNTPSLQKYKRMVDAWGGWSLFQKLLQTMKIIAAKYGVSIPTVAVRYILDQPAVAGSMIGVRLGLSEHIKDANAVFSFKLDEDDMSSIQEVTKKGRDLLKVIGDCGDEYRRV